VLSAALVAQVAACWAKFAGSPGRYQPRLEREREFADQADSTGEWDCTGFADLVGKADFSGRYSL